MQSKFHHTYMYGWIKGWIDVCIDGPKWMYSWKDSYCLMDPCTEYSMYMYARSHGSITKGSMQFSDGSTAGH